VTAALADSTARAKVVTCDLKAGATCVRRILSTWLPKVFRRPVLDSEIVAYQSYLTTCASSPKPVCPCAMQAALLSPKFLFRAEVLPSTEAAICSDESPSDFDDEQTSWGNMRWPRASLISCGTRRPTMRCTPRPHPDRWPSPGSWRPKLDRMLATTALDQHPVSFVKDFPSQWLPLVALQSAQPSKAKFPAFDEPLRQAMADESRLFFGDILLKNGSALDLLRADYTYLNERLAKHYGIAGVTGTNMRRVDTSGVNRGGSPRRPAS